MARAAKAGDAQPQLPHRHRHRQAASRALPDPEWTLLALAGEAAPAPGCRVPWG